MCDGFNHGALQTAVAQICQSMGWDALQKSTHDLLTDVLQKYLEEIAKSAHGYSQLYCRTEPNLDDLNLAFQDIGVCLHELEDFVSQVDQVPFIHQLPRYPKPKPCVLHHPRNGEIAERLEQYYDYLPPLVSKLLQNEDEEKTAAEDADTVNTGEEQGSAEGFVRNEIKTVGEETSSQHVAVKRPHDTPPGLESEIKKRRVDLPFMQKGNRGNEMDILDALQGNLSSPSPTPSPDVWSTAKTFEIPPTSAVPPVIATSSKDSATSSKSTAKPKAEEKKAVKADKQPGKQPTGKAKASPKKKVQTPKKTPSPVKKSSSLTTAVSPKLAKEKSPSPMKSPVTNTKELTAKETEAKAKTPTKKIKTTPKKEKNSGNKTKKPVAKSPLTKAVPAAVKENVRVKESMPKLIIKPIKKEVNDDQQFTVSELLPPDKQEKTQPQKSKRKAVPSKKPKVKKEKEILEPSLKVEPKEWSTPSTSEGLKFSMAEFAMASVDSSVSTNLLTDPALEHKKKKKKRKEKDKDRDRKKDKSKKLKTDHTEPVQALPFSTPPIPRITVKLESSFQPALLTNKEMNKTETSQIEHGTDGTERLNPTVASSQMVDNLEATTSKVPIKQEPGVVANAAAATVPKLTIKSESLERTVVAQTLSTTCVHGYGKIYYCPVCGDPDDGSFMIGCDGCDEWFHGTCVGIIDDPGEVDWFCSSCHAKRDKDSKDKQKKKKKKKSKEKTK